MQGRSTAMRDWARWPVPLAGAGLLIAGVLRARDEGIATGTAGRRLGERGLMESASTARAPGTPRTPTSLTGLAAEILEQLEVIAAEHGDNVVEGLRWTIREYLGAKR